MRENTEFHLEKRQQYSKTYTHWFKRDVDHSDDEDRFIIMGLSQKTRLLVVCHCYRESDTIIRIISARKATKNESVDYSG